MHNYMKRETTYLKIRDAQGFTLWYGVNASSAKGSATINTHLK